MKQTVRLTLSVIYISLFILVCRSEEDGESVPLDKFNIDGSNGLSTTLPDPCFSSPCLNEGNCTADGDEFKCECPQGFTGQTCDSDIEKCKTCPENSDCFLGVDSFYCVCHGNFTGPECNVVDVLVTCQDSKTYRHLLDNSGEIGCAPYNNTIPSDICYDPDNPIVFKILNNPDNLFYSENNERNEETCLYLNDTSEVDSPEYCLTVTAFEADDIERRPHRQSHYNFCVIFNERPRLTPSSNFLTWNAANINAGDSVFSAEASDPFGTGTFTFSIDDVEPAEWGEYFGLSNQDNQTAVIWQRSGATVDIPSQGQDVIFTIEVDDGGKPPLKSSVNVTVTFVNASLFCSVPKNLYVGLQTPPTGAIGSISCVGTTSTGNLQYGLDHSGFTNISIQDDGGLVLTTTDLKPGTYNVTVDIVANHVETSVSFTIHADYFELQCPVAGTFNISENAPPQTCIDTHKCTSRLPSDVNSACNTELTGSLSDYMELNCQSFADITTVQICVTRNIMGQQVEGYHQLFGELKTRYGVTNITLDVDIINVNQAPSFSISTYTVTILETLSVGAFITQLLVADSDRGDNLSFSFSENGLPFMVVDNETMVTRSKLNATERQIYSFSVTATDSGGLSDSASISVSVRDVNEPPVCQYPNGDYVIIIQANTTSSSVIGDVDCYDTDFDDMFKRLTYTAIGLSTDLFSVADNGEIGLTRAIVSADSDSYKFNVTVTDGGGLSTVIEVTIRINSDFPPSCPLPVYSSSVSEDSTQCLTIITNCVDPLGGSLQYSVQGLNGSTIFQIRDNSQNDPLEICPSNSLKGKYGVWSLNMLVSNGFGVNYIRVDITVVDVNDPPTFPVNKVEDYISERKAVGSLAVVVTGVDTDFGNNAALTYNISSQISAFSINPVTGAIVVAEKLNASVMLLYDFSITVTDGGGLSASIPVSIHVIDINDPPECESPVQVYVNLTTSVGTQVGQLNCWDWDILADYADIVYIVSQQEAVAFEVTNDGAIVVSSNIPRTMSNFNFDVIVRDQQMITAGNFTGQKIVVVQVIVNSNFPPECTRTDISGTFDETQNINECLDKEITCEDPTGGTVTIQSTGGSGITLTQVRSRTTEIPSQLPLNLCIKSDIKNQVNSYEVFVDVTNGLGTTRVTWKFDILDVNEAPVFLGSPYNFSTPETTGPGTKIYELTVMDSDIKQEYRTFSVSSTMKNQDQNEAVTISFIPPCCYFVTGRQNATERNLYEFELVARDGGNMSTVTTAMIHVLDVNEAPKCDNYNVQFSINLKAKVGDILHTLSCYDTDKDYNNKLLSYSLLGSTFFSVNDNGEITLANVLPRLQTAHGFNVRVSDNATQPLQVTVNVAITIDNNIPPECQPDVRYPDKWVINKCVTLDMNCIDPTTDDTSTLTYTLRGNYSSGFTDRIVEKGKYEFCYTLTTGNTFMVTVQVYNGLANHYYNLPLEVKYDQSTPQFGQSVYSATLQESTPAGSSVVDVDATSPSGNIEYSVTGADLQEWNSYFQLNSATGIITTKSSIISLSDTQVTLTIQALNDFSKLKSTARVIISVSDINEPPTCTSTDTGNKNINVDVAIGTVLRTYTCSDPDVNELNKKLAFTLSTIPDNQYFELDVSGNTVRVKVKQVLAVNIGSYTLTTLVSDSGSPPRNITLELPVIVNLSPPLPVIGAYAINSSKIEVQWRYDRTDFYSVTQYFIIVLTTTSQPNRNVRMDSRASLTNAIIDGLQAETIYRISLTAVTNYGNITTSPLDIKTAAIPRIARVMASFKLTDKQYEARLQDPFSFSYVQLKEQVEGQVKPGLIDTPGFVNFIVNSFRSGSVIVDAVISTNQSGNPNDTAKILQEKISTGWIGDLAVDPNYFITGPGNGYIRVISLTSETVLITNNSRVVFTCTSELVGQVGTTRVTWTLNGSPLNPSSSSRFSIVSHNEDPNKPGERINTLTISPVYVRDQGQIICKALDDTGLSSSMAKDFSVVHQPYVIISPRSKTLSEGENITITCTVQSPRNYPARIIWYKNDDILQLSDGESKIIINQFSETLVVTNLRSRVLYGCSANNTAGVGMIKTAHIGVIAAQSYKCIRDQDKEGTIWAITVEGSSDIQDCPNGRIGTAVRVCLQGGIWDTPDYSNCARQDLINIADQTEKLKEGLLVESVENILTNLANLTGDSDSFVEGEMEAGMTALNNVAEYSQENVEDITDNSLEKMAQCASDMLDPRTFVEWEGLIRKNKDGASRIMRSVSEISISSTRRTQMTSQVIVKPNIVLETRRVVNEDILFPDLSKENTFPDWVKPSTHARISKQSFNQDQQIGVSNIIYKNLTEILHKLLVENSVVKDIKYTMDVNSDVIDITIDNPPQKLNPPLEVTFEHLSDNYSNPLCSWWDFSVPNTPNGAWSTEGCVLFSTSDTVTVCKCDHLTNFAVLMSPGKTPEQHILALSIISAVGCGLSLLFLLITVAVYFAFWRYVKSDRAIILMNLCVSLILAYIVFLAGVNRTENKDICTAVSAVLHYLFLVSFSLMLAEGIEIAVSVLYVFSTRSRIRWLMPCAWIIPAVVVGISLGVTQLKGYGNDQFCWLSLEDGVLWAFVGPACFIVLVNFVIVCLVLKTMLSSHTMMTKSSKEQAKSAIRSLCVILPIMGVTWVLGVFSVNEELVIFQYIFALCNTLQGFFIFLFHCLTNRQIHDAVKHNRRRKRSLAEFTKSTSHVHTNTKNEKERENSDKIQNNIEAEKKVNPFLEADRQVHEIVGKLSKKDDQKNAFDGKENDKNFDKNNILSLDDIKISNIMRETEVTGTTENTGSDMNTGSVLSGSQHSGSARGQSSGSERGQSTESDRVHSGSDIMHSESERGQHSGSERGQQSGSDRRQQSGQVNPAFRSSVVSSHRYEEVDSFYLGSIGDNQESQAYSSPAVYQPSRQQDKPTNQLSDKSSVSTNQQSAQKTSSSYEDLVQRQQSSSNQRFDPKSLSSSNQSKSIIHTAAPIQQQKQPPKVLPKSVQQRESVKQGPYNIGPQNMDRYDSRNSGSSDDFRKRMSDERNRVERVYSQTEKSGSGKSRDRKGKDTPKQQKYSPKGQRKAVQHEPSQRKGMPHWGKAKQAAAAKKQIKSHGGERSRSRDRAQAYAVPVDPYYEQPYARHPSLENVSVQYVGFDPFGGVHHGHAGYARPRRGRYDPWEEPTVDYW